MCHCRSSFQSRAPEERKKNLITDRRTLIHSTMRAGEVRFGSPGEKESKTPRLGGNPSRQSPTRNHLPTEEETNPPTPGWISPHSTGRAGGGAALRRGGWSGSAEDPAEKMAAGAASAWSECVRLPSGDPPLALPAPPLFPGPSLLQFPKETVATGYWALVPPFFPVVGAQSVVAGLPSLAAAPAVRLLESSGPAALPRWFSLSADSRPRQLPARGPCPSAATAAAATGCPSPTCSLQGPGQSSFLWPMGQLLLRVLQV